MKLTRTAAILLRQFYLLRGSPARVLPLFIWVAVDIVLWGFITRYLNSVSVPGMNFVPSLLGAVLFWDFCIRVMMGVRSTEVVSGGVPCTTPCTPNRFSVTHDWAWMAT
jgi:ABC-2 type transport system permease protein